MQSTEPEIWKPVVGYEGLYEVSDQGRVRSLDRVASDGRRLRGALKRLRNVDGAQKVTLSRDGLKRVFDTRRLVADAFGDGAGVSEWLPVPGTRGLYEVSDSGLIRSRPRRGSLGGLSKPQPTPSGHLSVSITVGGPSRMRMVHRLVALAFLGEAPAGTEVLHINGDPADNRIENLRYGTRSENVMDQVKHGVHNNASKTHCKWGHDFTPENTKMKSGGGRVCRTCNEQWQADYQARRSAQVAV